jgi:hypothetical protein
VSEDPRSRQGCGGSVSDPVGLLSPLSIAYGGLFAATLWVFSRMRNAVLNPNDFGTETLFYSALMLVCSGPARGLPPPVPSVHLALIIILTNLCAVRIAQFIVLLMDDVDELVRL